MGRDGALSCEDWRPRWPQLSVHSMAPFDGPSGNTQRLRNTGNYPRFRFDTASANQVQSTRTKTTTTLYRSTVPAATLAGDIFHLLYRHSGLHGTAYPFGFRRSGGVCHSTKYKVPNTDCAKGNCDADNRFLHRHLTSALSGTQQAPRSGILLLLARDERIRRDFPLRGNGIKCQDWVVHSI